MILKQKDMGLKLGDLFIKLGLDKKEYDKGINDAKKNTDAFAGGVEKSSTTAKKGFNGLQFQIQQFARELPSLGYGVGIFFAAISNNLPMLTDEIKKAKAENQALAASGQKGVPVWKQMASGIFSWQTALVVGLTLLVAYGRQIGTFFSEIFKGKNVIDSMSSGLAANSESAKKATKSMQEELTQMKLRYVLATDNSKADNVRIKAAKELIDKYPGILKNYNAEQVAIKGNIDLYNKLRESIIASYKSRFAEEQIVENYREIAKQQKRINEGSFFTKVLKNIAPISLALASYSKDVDVSIKNIKKLNEANNKLFDDFIKGFDTASEKPLDKIFKSISDSESELQGMPNGSIAWYQKAISLLEEKRSIETDPKVRKNYSDNIQLLQQQLAAITQTESAFYKAKKAILDASKELSELPKGSIMWYEKEIELLEAKQKLITDPQLLEQSKNEIATRKSNLDLLTKQLQMIKSIKMENKDIAELFAKSIDEKKLMPKTGEKLDLVISPKMKADIDLSNARAEIENKAEELGKNFGESLNQAISNGIADAIVSLSEGLGEMFAGVKTDKEFGLAILETIGKFMVTLGSLMIAYAVQMGLFAESVKNPLTWPVALAAGIGMVAAGAAISGFASKGLKSSASASTASGYSGYSHMSSGAQTLTLDGKFILEGTQLIGAINNTNQRNNRIR